MFRDLRDLNRMGKEETKKRGGLFKMGKDGLAQANQMVQQLQADQALAEELATSGVAGQATIKSQAFTGAEVNMMPVIKFELSVDVNGFKSDVTHTQPVSPALLGQLQPGATVSCKVDPNDHSRLILG